MLTWRFILIKRKEIFQNIISLLPSSSCRWKPWKPYGNPDVVPYTVAPGNPRNWVLNDDGKSERPPKAVENVI